MAGIWVIAEHRDGRAKKVTLELLGLGRQLAGALSEELAVLVLAADGRGVAEALSGSADRVLVVQDPALATYCTEGYTQAVAELVQARSPSLLLIGATSQGKDLAPRLATRLKAGLVPDCIKIELLDGRLVMTRPVFAGKAFVKVASRTTPQMASVRPNVMPPAEPAARPGTVEILTPQAPLGVRTKTLEVVASGGETLELTEADIIVSGGRGLKGPEHFSLVETLAQAMGAAVGASRAVVDAGWMPHPFQVGQTGKTVSPTLYVACGISGAIQHLAGMSSSKFIVAINKDPEAPIFKIADYGIVGDVFEVLPLLTEEVKRLKAEGA
ncbi:MAG: electron transfer flavoprotein subunit alpha/FixB family protein [Deltaproteobacteria bacterium]|nr:electron transfer flavoprotein subunit alpha/FixB family protein [Deltaproteobacteria bacterium]